MSREPKSNRYVALGARLKFLREQWQQTLRDVCDTLEIDENMLRAYEEGTVAPSNEVLDMLISHFLLTEDQAQDLRELADDGRTEDNGVQAGIEEMLGRQLVMFMPIDSRVIYTDSMQATITDGGVILQFMQQAGGQSVAISKVGMSREHAEKVIQVLQNSLKHHDQHSQKQLPAPDNESKQS